MQVLKLYTLCIVISCLLSGCGTAEPVVLPDRSVSVEYSPEPTHTPTPQPTFSPVPTPTNTPVPGLDAAGYTTLKPYEVGQILIIMYHGLIDEDDTNNYYQRNRDNFRNDLQTLYDRGFRLITMRDWIDNNISTEAGKTPVIFTFDDGKASSFSLEKGASGNLAPAQGCAVEIMEKFAVDHPDFGKTAMFFICNGPEPFVGEGTLAERFAYLIDNGYEIGNHTQNHESMNTMDSDTIQAEIGFIDQMIKTNIPSYEPFAFSYPFGIRPVEELRKYIYEGTYNGDKYQYLFGLREGQSGTPSAVNRVGFDPLCVPRVRASDNEVTDLWWQLRDYDQFPEKRYVSDGIANRISVPLQHRDNVDVDSLNGKELYIYNENGERVTE